MSLQTGTNITIKTYTYATQHFYLVPLMIYKFIKNLPNYNFSTWPKLKWNKDGYWIYSRNYI